MLSVRRVVTGHAPSGRATVIVDEIATQVSTLRQGAEAAVVWTTEGFPVSNDGNADEATRKVATAHPNGTVFRVIDYAPGVTPRFHRTESIDYAVVMSGEIWMKLDAGEEVLLRAGDVLVQRGTIHDWINRSSEICRIAFVLVSASRVANANADMSAEG